jgi:hypothetical protein
MKTYILYPFLIFFIVLSQEFLAQDGDNSESVNLFSEEGMLYLKLNYSNKAVKKNSNDSTYIKTELSYKEIDGSWKKINSKIKRRGNNRLKNCYFTPIKLKIKKSVAVGTVFEGNNKLKLVLPCIQQKDLNDNILKEFMAYKLFELISPYHFKTRLAVIDYKEKRGDGFKLHQIKGILIEDIDKTADRYEGKVIERGIHPLTQDGACSIRNDFFQYMIGNTDYSIAHQHNQKLLYIDKMIVPIPYDFDMSGLVNASYSVVPTANGNQLEINNVTQRLFRGYKRDERIYQKIRKEFLDNQMAFFEIVDSLKSNFSEAREFSKARKFISDFFEILNNDKKFKNEILSKARTK